MDSATESWLSAYAARRQAGCHRCSHEFDVDLAGGPTEWTAYICDGVGETECANLICWTCLLKSDLCRTCQADAHPFVVALTVSELLALDSGPVHIVEATR